MKKILLGIIFWGLTFASTLLAETHTITSDADSGPGTLRDCISKAQVGDTIKPNASVKTIKLNSELTIKSGITIEGLSSNPNGAPEFTIDGQNKTRIFNIDLTNTSEKVTLNNLTIQNGHAPDGTVDKVTGQDGGGIWIGPDDEVDINNCYFQNNTAGNGYASQYVGNGGNGGGIYSLGVVDLVSCTLQGNTAGKGGSSNIDATGSNNGGNGGAICSLVDPRGSSSLFVEHCHIENNTAGENGTKTSISPLPQIYEAGSTGNGGAIYSDSTMIIRSNSSITNNKTYNVTGKSDDNYKAGNGGSGGGIYILNHHRNETVYIHDSTISDNSTGDGGEYYPGDLPKMHHAGTGGFGGGIAVYTGGSGDPQHVKFKNLQILNNKTGKGGDSSLLVDIYGGDGGSGGGIYVYKDAQLVNNISFMNNTVKDNSTGAGGIGVRPGFGGNGGGLCSNVSFTPDPSNTVESNTVAPGGKGDNIYPTSGRQL